MRYYLCEQIAKLKNRRILDLGCNIGIISGCADKTNTIIGIDLNKKAIEIAKNIYRANTYIVQNLYRYKERKFDVIILANMIDRHNQKTLIKKAGSLLKKDGVLYLTTPNRNNNYYEKSTHLPTYQQILDWLTPVFKNEKVVLWNPISIRAGHFAFPGAYTLMKWISLLFSSKKSVSIYIKARKL